MRATAAILIIGLAPLSSPVSAQSAPESLRNKSVVVNWTVNRSLRLVGEGPFRDMSTPFSLAIYISSAGRPFARTTATPGRRSGSAEAVGTSGKSYSGGTRQVRFSGNTIEVLASNSGGARRVVVQVSGGGCSAQVTIGKDVGGSGVMRAKSLASGKAIEVRSVAVTSTSCSVREGNVFGN
jgi:hypothetical protein